MQNTWGKGEMQAIFFFLEMERINCGYWHACNDGRKIYPEE
jgi:hypothetical protein